MTDPKVSEDNLEKVRDALIFYGDEAAAIAAKLNGKSVIDNPRAVEASLVVLALDGGQRARAALTAAAEVRGRAVPSDREAIVWKTYSDLLNRFRLAHKGGKTTEWQKIDGAIKIVEEIWPAETQSYVRHYSTEPDSGPDVLGMQKGE